MAKEKLKLSDLKVQSFVTALDEGQMNRLKGGHVIKGRRFNYRTRWTAVDTRSDATLLDPATDTVSAG